MGNLINLPLKVDQELYLLCLVPQNRTGCFVYHYDVNRRCIFTVFDNGKLEDFEVQSFLRGGIFEVYGGDEGPQIGGKFLAQAGRITKEQYKIWDELRIMDRIQLQIEWAADAVRRAEDDLAKVIELPDNNPDNIHKWDTAALHIMIDRIMQASGELDGLYNALSAL